MTTPLSAHKSEDNLGYKFPLPSSVYDETRKK